MPEIKLDSRLEKISRLVRLDRVICDVGTDHALLPCRLYLMGAKNITASDINDGPLKSAEATIKKYLGRCENIRLVKSDGLDNIDFADEIIIDGMGGDLIGDIVSRIRFANEETRLILQPMSKAEILRKRLYQSGYYLIDEHIVMDNAKPYLIMQAGYNGEVSQIDDYFAYTGLVKDLYSLWLLKNRLKRAANGCRTAQPQKAESLNAIAQRIEAYIKENGEKV